MVVLEGVLNSTAPSIPVSLSQNMGSPSADINFSVKQIIITMPDGRRSNVTVSTGNTLTPELNGTNTTSVAVVSTAVPSTLSLLNGKPVPLITSIRSSLDSTDPMNDALLDYTFAFMAGPEALLQSHVEAWNQLWGSGFEITGRHDVALAVNSSLYYLLSSIRSDMPHSLSPGGLASNGYNGHTFWDCETWMYPSLLMWHPDIAQSLLQYRYDRREVLIIVIISIVVAVVIIITIIAIASLGSSHEGSLLFSPVQGHHVSLGECICRDRSLSHLGFHRRI